MFNCCSSCDINQNIDSVTLRQNLESFRTSKIKIPNISTKLTTQENQYRLKLLNKIIKNTDQNLKIQYNEKLLPNAIDRNLCFSRDKSLFIDSMYPLSCHPTIHQIIFNQGIYTYGLCAIDAIGSAACFECDVTICSKCIDTSKALVISVKKNCLSIKKIAGPDTVYILYPDLNLCNSWANNCCKIMNFFESLDNMIDFIYKNSLQNASLFALTLDEALDCAKKLFTIIKK